MNNKMISSHSSDLKNIFHVQYVSIILNIDRNIDELTYNIWTILRHREPVYVILICMPIVSVSTVSFCKMSMTYFAHTTRKYVILFFWIRNYKSILEHIDC